MSAATFIGMGGTIYVMGYDGLAYIMGWTGGYVLLAVFLGPYLRKFGQYTIPDFLGERYGGNITAPDRRPRRGHRLVHLPDRAGHRRRHHHQPLPRHRFRRRDLRRPRRHPRLLAARRHEVGHLDAGRAVPDPDHRVPDPRDRDVLQAHRRAGRPDHVRADPPEDRRPGEADHRRPGGGRGPREVGRAEPARSARSSRTRPSRPPSGRNSSRTRKAPSPPPSRSSPTCSRSRARTGKTCSRSPSA